MNIHHLELFYHVVRFGGVSAAARQMPYGIQQSSISSQIIQLEDDLGKSLFRRRPFELTAEGRLLFDFIEPFFSGLDPMADRIRGGAEKHLRIACPEVVQRDYLPALLAAVRARMPDFHFALESGRMPEIKEGLRAGRIDIGLATLWDEELPGIDYQPLLRMPMILLVPKKSPITELRQILEKDRIDLPLITLPHHEPSCRHFLAQLHKQGVDWFPSLELASLDLVSSYVSSGFGIGLSVHIPDVPLPKDLRILKLPDFPEVHFGAFTSGPTSPLIQQFLEEAKAVAARMMGG